MLGILDGTRVGLYVVGGTDGCIVGIELGLFVGRVDGGKVNNILGCTVGSVGDFPLGWLVGWPEGQAFRS